MGQNRQKLPCPKLEFFTTPLSLIWAKNRIYGYGAKSQWGIPGVHLGANGVPLGTKNGSKNCHAPKFEFLTTLRSSIWAKIELTVLAPNHGGDPLGSILGPMVSHWDQKMGQNRKKLPCPKIRIFDYHAVIDLGNKSILMVMASNHSGDPLGSILGPMGYHWGQKMGQKGKKLPCPKSRIFCYSAVIDLGKKSNLRWWRQIMVGTP